MIDTASPIIEFRGVVRSYGGLRPLRVRALAVAPGETMVLSGLDAGAAEAFVHLVTGATVPEAGDVLIDGRPTTEIAADTEWLISLDRFGLVSDRAVLVPSLSIAANLALPLTLAVDPMAPDVRRDVEDRAALVALPAERLDAPAGDLTPAERLRVHLARAVTSGPRVILLEHPTAATRGPGEPEAFGRLLASVARARGVGWIAISEDAAFADASGGRRHRLKAATGDLVVEDAGWRRWFR